MTKPYRRLLLPLLFIATLAACGGGGGGASAPSTPVVVFVDTDKDGVADSEDVAPGDPLCAAASDAAAGVCFLKSLASVPLKIVSNDGGKVVFLAEEDTLRVYLYDLNTRHFLGRGSITGFTPRLFAYSAEHARLYVSDGTNRIHSYNEAMQESATPFATLPQSVAGLATAGKYLVAQDYSGAWATHYVYDKQGTLTDSKDWNYYSGHYAWSQPQSRLYFFRDSQTPNDLMFEVIDQTTGKITSAGETPYHGDYTIQGPITVSSAGDKVVLGSGDIYSTPLLTWAGTIGITVTQAAWLASGDLVTLEPAGAKTRLTRFLPNRTPGETLLIEGNALGLFAVGNNNYLITKKVASVDIAKYVPSDDNDGDGVVNTIDKFPLDKTAAVDTDNDGYPDAFLAAYGPADSTTGLTLDAYPNDPSCHVAADGDGTLCNASKNVPPYLPDAVTADDQGIVYALSVENKRLYRWSSNLNAYLAPIVVGNNASAHGLMPTFMRYVGSHQRIYFGYPSGLITYVNLSGDTRESSLANTARGIDGLASAGNFLLAHDSSGAWGTQYVFDQQGGLRYSQEWKTYSSAYEWNASQQRMYYMQSNFTPDDVLYEVIDQSSGKIGSEGESPYHGDYPVAGPLRLSSGGTRLYTGAGMVYDTANLRILKNLGKSALDAQWTPDGMLITLSGSVSSGSTLQIYNGALILVSENTYPGGPKALVKAGSRVVLVSQDGDRPRFTVVPY
jgi:hypothetical protein